VQDFIDSSWLWGILTISGVKNRHLDFIEQANETANAIHNLIKSSLDIHKLDTRNLTSYCADNADVNYGKSVYKLLREDNKNVLKINCHKTCVWWIGCGYWNDCLKTCGHFSVSAKRREELKSFFGLVTVERWEIVHRVPARLSPKLAVDRLIQNCYLLRVISEVWVTVKKKVMKIQKKNYWGISYFSPPNIGAVLVQSAKTLETANVCSDNIQQIIENRFLILPLKKILFESTCAEMC
jgi:hypothetical protein